MRRRLCNALREIKAGENPTLQFEIAQVKEALTVLNIRPARKRDIILTDESDWARAGR
jgi:hypothetical protein